MAIIRPGTYTIKEKFTVPSKTIAGLRDYKYYPLTANDTYGAASNSMGYMYVYDDSITLGGNTMYDSFVYGKPNGTWNYQDATEWDDDGNTANSVTYTATDTTKLRTIIVETDQTVDDEFYAWFNANIEKPRLSVDVSTLAGWTNLSAGEKNITIVAKAADFKNSAPSAAVQVTKAASTKTLAAGTYKFIDAPDVSMFTYPNGVFSDFNFTSNGKTFTRLLVRSDASTYSSCDILYIPAPSGWQDVGGVKFSKAFAWGGYDEDYTWRDVSAYQTITLATDQQVSADFYEWAITEGNLVKQPTGETWVLNETLSSSAIGNHNFITNFTTNGQSMIKIECDSNVGGTIDYRDANNEYVQVYAVGKWSNSAYRTLTFETAPTGDLLTWLQANGKQRS